MRWRTSAANHYVQMLRYFFNGLSDLQQGAWRKRVGVQPTTRLAKSRIAGFEGREDHRIPFASAKSIGVTRGWRQTRKSDSFESALRPDRTALAPCTLRSRSVPRDRQVFRPAGVRAPDLCEAPGARRFPRSEPGRKKASRSPLPTASPAWSRRNRGKSPRTVFGSLPRSVRFRSGCSAPEIHRVLQQKLPAWPEESEKWRSWISEQ